MGEAAASASSSNTTYLRTARAVCEGQPDQLCNLISEAVLDACLGTESSSSSSSQPTTMTSSVSCDVVTTVQTGMVMITGEISTGTVVNYEQVIRDAVKSVGYDDPATGFDYKTCNVIVAVEEQSPDLAAARVGSTDADRGAGDCTVAVGTAVQESTTTTTTTSTTKTTTNNYVSAVDIYARQLAAKLATVRRDGTLPWLRPDGQVLLTCTYANDDNNGIPIVQSIHTVVICAQHAEDVTIDQARDGLRQHVVQAVLPAHLLTEQTNFILQPTRFVIGGPHADAGRTMGLAGRDGTLRAGHYAARWVAKSLVAAGLCQSCTVQLTYVTGTPGPISIAVDAKTTTGGSSQQQERTESEWVQIVQDSFDLRVGCLVRDLQLTRPMYRAIWSAGGPFGHTTTDTTDQFPWEKVKELKL